MNLLKNTLIFGIILTLVTTHMANSEESDVTHPYDVVKSFYKVLMSDNLNEDTLPNIFVKEDMLALKASKKYRGKSNKEVLKSLWRYFYLNRNIFLSKRENNKRTFDGYLFSILFFNAPKGDLFINSDGGVYVVVSTMNQPEQIWKNVYLPIEKCTNPAKTNKNYLISLAGISINGVAFELFQSDVDFLKNKRIDSLQKILNLNKLWKTSE